MLLCSPQAYEQSFKTGMWAERRVCLLNLGLTDGRDVLVPISQADAARTLLAAQEPPEEELAAEADADTMTLEEAEARVK